MSFGRIGVVGGGAWGTALAQVAAADGAEVLLWALESEVVEAVNGAHENSLYLAGVPLSPSIRAVGELGALAAAEALLIVTPAQHLRGVLGKLPAGAAPLILCAKGIEAGTQLLMSEVAAQARPGAPIAVLSGPTFAQEVAEGLPTAITLACADEALGAEIADRLARPGFRPYLSTDVIGAEIGGAVKNVLAIACGVVEGAGLGQNARAALISRGFAEMTRFGLARRAARDAGRAFGAWRSGAHLFLDELTQFLTGQRAGRGAHPHRAARRPAHRGGGRAHRPRARRGGAGGGGGDADHRRGVRAADG
jgi:glycerol-3-phosphate dehydrogenase (NAD(P)+)